MTVEMYRSVKDELHALNRRICSLLSAPNNALPGWGHASSFRHILDKYLPANLEVGRGIIAGDAESSQLIEILIYDQNVPVLYREADTVCVSPKAVRGVVSILPESTDIGMFDLQLTRLAQAAAIVNRAAKLQVGAGSACFSGLLSYRSDVRTSVDTAELLEYLADEEWGNWVSEVCMAGGPYLSMKEILGVREWKELSISSADTAVATFIGRLFEYLGVEVEEAVPVKAAARVSTSEMVTSAHTANGTFTSVELNPAKDIRTSPVEAPTRQNGHNGRKKERRFRRFSNKLSGKQPEIEAANTVDVPTEPHTKIVSNPAIDQQDREGNTGLHRAVITGNNEEIESLLNQGANINIKNKEGNTPLHLAAIENQVESVKRLLAHHADINARNYIYSTPLHIAATEDHDEVARILLNDGAELEARNNRALTPLHRAAMCGSMRTAEVLLSFEADLNATTEKGISALHLAAWFGQVDALQLLIDSQGDLNAQCEKGNTPLHFAAFNGQVKTIKVLINNSADMSVPNQRGELYLQCINEGYRDERLLVLED